MGFSFDDDDDYGNDDYLMLPNLRQNHIQQNRHTASLRTTGQ